MWTIGSFELASPGVLVVPLRNRGSRIDRFRGLDRLLAGATADRVTGMGAGEVNLLRVLDVDGVRVVIAEAYSPATPDTDLAALDRVIDSVEIQT